LFIALPVTPEGGGDELAGKGAVLHGLHDTGFNDYSALLA